MEGRRSPVKILPRRVKSLQFHLNLGVTDIDDDYYVEIQPKRNKGQSKHDEGVTIKEISEKFI